MPAPPGLTANVPDITARATVVTAEPAVRTAGAAPPAGRDGAGGGAGPGHSAQ